MTDAAGAVFLKEEQESEGRGEGDYIDLSLCFCFADLIPHARILLQKLREKPTEMRACICSATPVLISLQ